VPISFTVGASPAISIGGVRNGASFLHNYAPGMALVCCLGLRRPIHWTAYAAAVLPCRASPHRETAWRPPALLRLTLQIIFRYLYETGAGTAVVGINNNGKVASFSFNTTPTAPGIL